MATKKKLKNFAAFYIETGEDVEMFIEDISHLIVESEISSTVKTIDNPDEKEKNNQEQHEESCENIR